MQTTYDARCVILKSVSRQAFELCLFETPSGQFRVAYERGGQYKCSESVTDLHTALHMFEMKLAELEGH